MSAYGYDRLIRALYKYRPATIRALASLAQADNQDEAARVYFGDLLRVCAMANLAKGTEVPRLTDYLAPKQKQDDDAETLKQKLLARLKE